MAVSALDSAVLGRLTSVGCKPLPYLVALIDGIDIVVPTSGIWALMQGLRAARSRSGGGSGMIGQSDRLDANSVLPKGLVSNCTTCDSPPYSLVCEL